MNYVRRSPFCAYRHYKNGHVYKVLNDNVTRECDGVRMVHYAKMKDEVQHRSWIRPHDEFFGEVEQGRRRFEPILSAAELP